MLSIVQTREQKLYSVKDFPPDVIGRLVNWPLGKYNNRPVMKSSLFTTPHLIDLSCSSTGWTWSIYPDYPACIEILPSKTQLVVD